MRRKPYTARGISRVPCWRCGKPSSQQIQVCADQNQWRGLCKEHDIMLNGLVLWFINDPRIVEKMDAYVKRMEGIS